MLNMLNMLSVMLAKKEPPRIRATALKGATDGVGGVPVAVSTTPTPAKRSTAPRHLAIDDLTGKKQENER